MTPWSSPRPGRSPPGTRAVAAYRAGTAHPRPILWVDLEPGDRLADALARRGGVDLILGGPIQELARLAEAGRLEPESLRKAPPKIEAEAKPPQNPGDAGRMEPAASPPGIVDPRDHPAGLALVAADLSRDGWAAQYAGLVRRAALGRPSHLAGALPDDSHPWEGMAVVKAGRHRDQAVAFLASVAGPDGREPVAPIQGRVDGLIADLIGATLVDARDEMRSAWSALEQNRHPALAEAPFFEAPPWPPASVTKLRSEPADAPLLETLAEQVAPGPDERAWLLENWASTTRPIDGKILDDLAGAAGGRLAREPRFRSWLRAEWTAWARQRYRRVARVARGWVPS